MDVSAWVVWVAACLFWVAVMEWSSAQLVGLVGDFSASHSRIIDKTCFTGGVKEVCSVSLRPQQKLGGKKNRSCWKLKSKSEKENENERRPQKLVFSCLHFVDSPSFTIYDLFASKIKLLHVSQLSFDSWGDKKPKITINIHIRSFVTSLWATQPPNPTIIYKTLFCHSYSFGLNGLSKVPNFIWFSHCSTWFACTKSVGKKKTTKHGVSEKKNQNGWKWNFDELLLILTRTLICLGWLGQELPDW